MGGVGEQYLRVCTSQVPGEASLVDLGTTLCRTGLSKGTMPSNLEILEQTKASMLCPVCLLCSKFKTETLKKAIKRIVEKLSFWESCGAGIFQDTFFFFLSVPTPGAQMLVIRSGLTNPRMMET